MFKKKNKKHLKKLAFLKTLRARLTRFACFNLTFFACFNLGLTACSPPPTATRQAQPANHY